MILFDHLSELSHLLFIFLLGPVIIIINIRTIGQMVLNIGKRFDILWVKTITI